MAEINIKINPQGQLGMAVSEDMASNLAMVLGMLELAKQAWIDQAKQAQNRVQPVSMLPPGLS